MQIREVRFDTEECCDHLTVGGTAYSGTVGPDDVTVASGSQITFTSDDSVADSGFLFCAVGTTTYPEVTVVSHPSTACIVSGRCFGTAAGDYSNDESCTFTVHTAMTLSATTFDTEAYFDVVTIGEQRYSGTVGPRDVAVAANSQITWSSDGSDTDAGFTICPAMTPEDDDLILPTPAPTEPTVPEDDDLIMPTPAPTVPTSTRTACQDVQVIQTMSPGTHTYSGFTTETSKRATPSCGTSSPAQVYLGTLPPGYRIDIGLTSNTFDSITQLAHSGACPGITVAQCVDDPDTALLTFTNTLTSATTIYFIVSGFDAAYGNFTFSYTVSDSGSTPTPLQDDDQIDIPTTPFQGACMFSETLSMNAGGIHSGSTSSASGQAALTCGSGYSPAQIYSTVVPAGYRIEIGQTWNTFDSLTQLAHSGPCPGSVVVSCVDDPDTAVLAWTNNLGTETNVYFIIAGYNAMTGSFNFSSTVSLPVTRPPTREHAYVPTTSRPTAPPGVSPPPTFIGIESPEPTTAHSPTNPPGDWVRINPCGVPTTYLPQRIISLPSQPNMSCHDAVSLIFSSGLYASVAEAPCGNSPDVAGLPTYAEAIAALAQRGCCGAGGTAASCRRPGHVVTGAPTPTRSSAHGSTSSHTAAVAAGLVVGVAIVAGAAVYVVMRGRRGGVATKQGYTNVAFDQDVDAVPADSELLECSGTSHGPVPPQPNPVTAPDIYEGEDDAMA